MTDRDKFDYFKNEMVKELDRYFVEDQGKYTDMVNRLKAQGIRIFRNSQGKHKIKYVILGGGE